MDQTVPTCEGPVDLSPELGLGVGIAESALELASGFQQIAEALAAVTLPIERWTLIELIEADVALRHLADNFPEHHPWFRELHDRITDRLSKQDPASESGEAAE